MSNTTVFQLSGPPYAPTTAASGLQPNIAVDVPICAVLIPLFLLAAAGNLASMHINHHREHLRVLGVMPAIFCFARVVALSMRMAWASHPDSINLAIAAEVFTMAAFVLLFIVNILFVRRMLYDYAAFGRFPAIKFVPPVLIFYMIACFVMVVSATVYTFFTLDEHVRQQCRDIQLLAITSLAVLAFLPIPAAVLGLIFPAQAEFRVPRARFVARHQLLFFTAVLLTLGASYRAATIWIVDPIESPGWYDSKACYYCFNFAIDLVVLYTILLARFDKRFRMLDHADVELDSDTTQGANSFREVSQKVGHDGRLPGAHSFWIPVIDRINRQGEIFGLKPY